MSEVKKNLSPHNHDQTTDEDVRLFFHDILNHTHGINLFLSQKIHQTQGLTPEETLLIHSEMQKLQQFIKSRNSSNEELTGLSECLLQIKNLVKNFLPENKFQVRINFSNCEFLTEKWSISTDSSRILTNIIKNIADHGSGKVDLRFECIDGKFICQTTNEIHISEFGERVSGQGLGLESVHKLSRALGGSFASFSSEGLWKNKIILPLSSSQAKNFHTKKSA